MKERNVIWRLITVYFPGISVNYGPQKEIDYRPHVRQLWPHIR